MDGNIGLRNPFFSYIKLRRDGVYNPIAHVLKVIEAFKRFGRGCKLRPASVFIKTEAINQSVICFVIAIHGNWIPAIPAGMTGRTFLVS